MAEPEPEWFEGVPAPLAEVIRQATRYRREERYPSARAMSDALRAVVELLPEDPGGTPDLVVNAPDRRRGAEVLDTLAQLNSGTGVVDSAGPGTMVPDVGIPDDPPDSFPTPKPTSPRPTHDQSKLLPALAVLVTLGVAGVVVWQLSPEEPPSRPAPSLVPASRLPLVQAPVDTHPVAPATPLPEPASAATAPAVAPSPPLAPVAAVAPVAAPVAPVALVAAPVAAPVEQPVATPTVEVTPVVKPVAPPAARLTTTGPTTVAQAGTVKVVATLSGRYTLKLYYRGSSGAFRNKPMTPDGANGYSASFTIDETMSAGVDYFVAATDPNGNVVRDGSPTAPIHVAVQ